MTSSRSSSPSDQPKKIVEYDTSVTVRSLMKTMGVTDLMRLPGVTEVSINRPGEIWTETSEGWTRHAAPALTLDVCKKLATALTIYNKTMPPLSAAAPIKPVCLPDGERGQVMIAPACEPGTVSITIRVPGTVRLTMDDYERSGTLAGYRDVSPSALLAYSTSTSTSTSTVHATSAAHAAPALDEMRLDGIHDASYRGVVPAGVTLAAFELEMLAAKAQGNIRRLFELAIQHKLNIVTVGGVGSGKTTLMKALADLVAPGTRVGTIEDTHELSLPNHPNRVHMFYSDSLPAKEIVKSTLRMKLDRVFLAELRGDETWDYMTLLNTASGGGMTSVHANDPPSTFSRIATLVKASEVGQTLDWNYIYREVKMTIDLVLFMNQKRLTQIYYDPVEKYKLLRGLA
jgi:type IV secretion system protein VirB11